MRFGDGLCPCAERFAIEAYFDVPSVRELLARCGACASDMAAIKEVVALEWAFFDRVEGLEGRAVCQDDARSFFIYRLAQYLAFPFMFVHLVLDDLKGFREVRAHDGRDRPRALPCGLVPRASRRIAG